MTPGDFARVLFLALDDPDERLARLAREVKAAIERGDIDAASKGVRTMPLRMGALRLKRQG